MTYLEGTKTSLICNATNDADAANEANITWFYKNSTSLYQIVSNNNRKIHNVRNSTIEQLYSILLFEPVNRTDEGVYICRASNHPQSSTELSTKVKIKSNEFVRTVYFLKVQWNPSKMDTIGKYICPLL